MKKTGQLTRRDYQVERTAGRVTLMALDEYEAQFQKTLANYKRKHPVKNLWWRAFGGVIHYDGITAWLPGAVPQYISLGWWRFKRRSLLTWYSVRLAWIRFLIYLQKHA